MTPTTAEWALKAAEHIEKLEADQKDLNQALKRGIAHIRELEADRAALLALLRKVLDTREEEAKAHMSYENARENFSDSTEESKAHTRAMVAASKAEREAREFIANVEGK